MSCGGGVGVCDVVYVAIDVVAGVAGVFVSVGVSLAGCVVGGIWSFCCWYCG